MKARKLLLNEAVEVRQLEEGLRGSWHPGLVVGVSNLCRQVMYEELLCESGNSKLIESIPATEEIEGLYQRHSIKFNHRGRIRPKPPKPQQSVTSSKLTLGVCVDVLYREAWWEGVVFDCDEGAKECRVFFPDEGDEEVFKLADLRLTYVWDEFSGQWRERGAWVLVDLAKEYKKDGHLFQFIRRVWSRLKVHYGFRKMISEWTCGAYCVWKEYFRDIIDEMTTKPKGKDISFPNISQIHVVQKRKGKSKRSKLRFLDASVLKGSMQKRKSKEIGLSVRTRHMCMSDAEDSLVGVVSKSGYLTDGHCMRRRKRKDKGVRLSVRTRRMCMSDAEDSFVGSVSKSGYLTDGHCMRRQRVTVGRSITTSCQEQETKDALESPQKKKGNKSICRDSVCLVCQYGGELFHCDMCLSSYHMNCIGLEEAHAGESFCPSCKCGLCGSDYSDNGDQLFTQVCYQCSRKYHVACLNEAGTSVSDNCFSDKFCSRSCFEICARLHKLLQISNPTSREGFTWTITRSRRNDCNVHNERFHTLIQVSQVLNAFHECFEPIIEPHTGRDLVADIVYNSGSKFRRLDFHGFYVIALVHNEEPVCVATIRIHGQKVAEMPLVATRFKYRRKGMCRLLVDELEKMLVEMGVERLVLPAIAQLSNTWVSSFGFTDMPSLLRKELLGYPFVLFQGTTMFQKILRRSAPTDSLRATKELRRTGLAVVQENSLEHDLNRTYNLHYKRRRKAESTRERKKSLIDGAERQHHTYKCVYKRRRIQASRNLIASH
ncbi:unnamed protein product [Amaranthus hypochondriacus]